MSECLHIGAAPREVTDSAVLVCPCCGAHLEIETITNRYIEQLWIPTIWSNGLLDRQITYRTTAQYTLKIDD